MLFTFRRHDKARPKPSPIAQVSPRPPGAFRFQFLITPCPSQSSPVILQTAESSPVTPWQRPVTLPVNAGPRLATHGSEHPADGTEFSAAPRGWADDEAT